MASPATTPHPRRAAENAWFDNVKVTLFDYTPVSVAPSTWGAVKISYR